jgi:hypothetical protein
MLKNFFIFKKNIVLYTKSNMSSGSGNITAGFIDLATYDELEKYLYGSASAITYFVRETKRATWFTHIPVALSGGGTKPDFGTENFSVKISRCGDYMLYNWIRVTFPTVELSEINKNLHIAGADGLSLSLRWTRNLMHNLVKEFYISFNDLVEFRLDSHHLDFWNAFTVPSSKSLGYDNMIGNFPSVNNPRAAGAVVPPGTTTGVYGVGNYRKGQRVLGFSLNLPLPHCHSRDSGVALPTAALPYNEMRMGFTFRGYSELLMVSNASTTITHNGLVPGHSRPAMSSDLLNGAPVLSDVKVWANYAIVSNNERTVMGANARDMLIEQVQSNPTTCSFDPATNSTQSYDLRMSHAIKALFWGVKNVTNSAEHSNYTAASPNSTITGVSYDTTEAADPIERCTLTYENSRRLDDMNADYFSLIVPFYHAVSIPDETGYHMYSYSLDLMSTDPMGSTNYGKLTNVSLSVTASATAIATAGATAGTAASALAGHHAPQKFCFILTAINHNIVRITGGALGFPVL